jgi:hypothetical protein
VLGFGEGRGARGTAHDGGGGTVARAERAINGVEKRREVVLSSLNSDEMFGGRSFSLFQWSPLVCSHLIRFENKITVS